jgi:hypothetical protein
VTKTAWIKGCRFEFVKGIDNLSIDAKGDIGEAVVIQLLQNDYVVVWEPTTVEDWDFRATNRVSGSELKIEVKFASMGEGKNWQHEGFQSGRDYDGAICFDVAPDVVYAVCLGKHELPFGKKPSNPFVPGYGGKGKGMHLRPNTANNKWTITKKQLVKTENQPTMFQVDTVADFLKSYHAMEERIHSYWARKGK